jgi:hypothetical protein
MAALWEAVRAYRKAIDVAESAGQAAHDAWCADHDWAELTDEERESWEDAGQAAIDFYLAAQRRAEITTEGRE